MARDARDVERVELSRQQPSGVMAQQLGLVRLGAHVVLGPDGREFRAARVQLVEQSEQLARDGAEVGPVQVYSATKAYVTQLSKLLRTELGRKKVRVATIEPGMVDTELPDHVTDPAASKLMADLITQIDVLQSEDVAETVAFLAAVPKHVNLTEITILPTEQAI